MLLPVLIYIQDIVLTFEGRKIIILTNDQLSPFPEVQV